MTIKADLHNHSYYSDGKHSPEFVLQRAHANGVTHLALTDHDCIDGLKQLVELGQTFPLSVINGVEISCQWNNLEIHVVGLFMSLEDAGLQQLLSSQQARRIERAEKIGEKLKKLNIQGLQTYLTNLNCRSITRSHVAQFLIDNGHCENHHKAFKSWLGRKGKIYVASQWCSLAEAVGIIRQAGGIAIVAHPDRYSLTNRRLHLLIEEFKGCGGEAMEVSYSNLAPDALKKLAAMCKAFDMWASTGSDFHDASRTWTDIGKIPALPRVCADKAIWLHPVWQV